MDIGIGIPNSIPGTTGPQLLEWARRADAAGFSTLATIGAVAFPTYDELTVLGAAAAVTERIKLLPNVLIAPARSATELAKQAATTDQLSGGRLTLGLGVGWRELDYTLTGRDFADRGTRFEEMMAEMQAAWRGQPIGGSPKLVTPPPAQPDGVPILVGGTTDAAVRRAAQFGIGWTGGGLPPDHIKAMADKVRVAWNEAGRSGEPRIVALVYFGLGNTEDRSRGYLLDYYELAGSEMAEMVAGSALRSPDVISGALSAYADAGVDELILDPTVSDPDQVDMLAEAVF